MISTSHKTWQTSLLCLELLQIQNLKRKSWGTSHIMSPHLKKSGGHIPRVPHQIAPMPAIIDDYKRSDTSFYSTKSWSRMGSLRQFRWFALKYFFGLYLKYFLHLQTLESGWHCPVALPGYAPCGNRILTAGYRPAQEFVIEQSSCAYQFGNSK